MTADLDDDAPPDQPAGSQPPSGDQRPPSDDQRRNGIRRLLPRRVLLQRRGFRVAVIALVVLLLLVVADRASARIASSKVASALATGITCVTGAKVSPTVTIGGFPFLAEVASKQFSSITITARELKLDQVAVQGLEIQANQVTPPADGHPASIGTVSVRATVPYSSLPATLAGRSLRYGASSDGRLIISTTTSLGGIPLPVSVVAKVQLEGSTLAVTPEEVRVLGIRRSISELDTGFGRWLARGQTSDPPDGISVMQQLPALPTGLQYASAVPVATGLTMTMTGHNVHAAKPKTCKQAS